MRARNALVASAAVAMFLAGPVAMAQGDAATEAKVKCEGVNSCKGHGDCKTARNECKGQNGCGGKGFVMMSEDECSAAKAKAAEKKEQEG